jgi:hypothetical protein
MMGVVRRDIHLSNWALAFAGEEESLSGVVLLSP